ncbi:MAG: efflux RND transporter periplasmic adaptor subunit [Francisellaceae bacterium]
MKRNHTVILIAILSFLLLLGGIYAKSTTHKKRKSERPSVSTEILSLTTYSNTIDAFGRVVSVEGINLKATASGMITAIDVSSGEDVKKGQTLIEINPAASKAQLSYDKAQLKLDQINYQRDQKLFKSHAVDAATLDSAKATYEKDQAQIAKDQAALNDRIITAPFDGNIGIIHVKTGDYVSEGDNLFALQTLSPIYVDFSVAAKDQGLIKTGQTVNISVDAWPNESFQGQIISINNQIDSTTNSLLVRAQLNNEDAKLLPGDMVDIVLSLSAPKSIIALPTQGIVYDGGKSYVFIINKDNIATKTAVTLGKQIGSNQVEITSGLKEGQTVVIAGGNKLSDGQTVKVIHSGETDA